MQTTIPQPPFDHRGQALPLPAEEERRRAFEAPGALEELATMGDDEEQAETFAVLVEAIDQDRMSNRCRFAE